MNVTLKDVGFSIWKNLRLLIVTALLGGILAVGMTCLVVKPTYTATAKLYVYNEKANDGYLSQGDLSVSKSLVDTCLIIARSTPVLQEAVEKLQPTYPDITVQEIGELLKGSSINETEVFFLSVTDPDGQKSADIVNAVAGLLPDELTRITKAATAQIIESAALPEEYNWPMVRNALLGGVVGLLACAVFVVVASKLDATVYGRRELTDTFRIPVIGAIPGKLGNAPVMLDKKADPSVTEAYRLASAHLMAASCKVIAVTSTVSGEGGACCAINMAKTLTQAGKRVLLIYGDIVKPDLPDVDVLHTNVSELKLSDLAQNGYDIILLLTPPLLSAADGAVLAKQVDGFLLSTVAGISNVEKMKEAVRILEQLDATILGLIVHNEDPYTEKYGRYIRWKKKYAGEEPKN